MIIRIQQGFPYPTKVRPFSHELVQNILWLGKGSYMADADLDIHKAAANVLVGNYCSIAHEVVFCLRHEHDYTKLTTFPMEFLDLEDVMQDREPEHIRQAQLGNRKDQIIIGHDVWIGRGAVLMGGVHIGNGAVVGAHAVVAKDVPPYAVVVGNPARVIKYRFPAEVIEKLQTIKWWYWPKEQVQALAETEDLNAFLQAHYRPIPLVEDEISQLLQRLKSQGKTICVFSPATGEGDALACRHVLEEYAGRFRKDAGIALFVELDGDGEAVQGILREIIRGHEDMPQVFLCQKKENVPLSLLQHADYLITTKNFRSLLYLDYGMDYGMKRMYGLSENVFSS